MLNQIQEKIRKAIPKLMKFENGCLFTIKDEYLPKELFGKVCQITDIRNSEWEELSFIFLQESISRQQFFKDKKLFNTKNPFIYEIFGPYDYEADESKLEDFVDIIGKEPKLNDVLFYLKLINVDDENLLTFINLWNLSNNFLKNQNEKVLINLTLLIYNFDK